MNTLIVLLAGLMVKVCAFETWPSPLRAATEAEPGVEMSDAGMLAVTWVALTNVVVRAAPFQSTDVPGAKLLPVAVSVKPGPTAVAAFGVIALTVGPGAPVTVQLTWITASPPRS